MELYGTGAGFPAGASLPGHNILCADSPGVVSAGQGAQS
jgi:hypothetical protein